MICLTMNGAWRPCQTVSQFPASVFLQVFWMAEPAAAGSTPQKKTAKRAAGRGGGAPDVFKLSDHVEAIEQLPWDEMMLDTRLDKGQVRPVEQSHVNNLVAHYDINEPYELELTVHLDQGMHPSAHVALASLPLSFIV